MHVRWSPKDCHGESHSSRAPVPLFPSGRQHILVKLDATAVGGYKLLPPSTPLRNQWSNSCLKSSPRTPQFGISPKTLKNTEQFDLTVASASQVRSYLLPSRFSVLVCPWYSLTNSIELGSLRSPGTRLTVRDARCHYGQSKLGSRSWN
jgi:hypothetical protein